MAAYPWFRMWNDLLASEKLLMLPAESFRDWVILLAVANKTTPRGTLPPSARLAFSLRCDEGEAATRVNVLVAAGLVDRSDDGALRPHDWDHWQKQGDKLSTERSRAWKEKRRAEDSGGDDPGTFRERSRNVPGTGGYVSSSSENTRDKESLSSEENRTYPPVPGTFRERSGNVPGTFPRKLPARRCPDYPDPDDLLDVHPGTHEHDEQAARQLWRRVWVTFGDLKLCQGWYQHQRWHPIDVWEAAFAQTKAQYPGQSVSVNLVLAIAGGMAANGTPGPRLPDAIAPRIARPRTPKQEWRDEAEAKLARLTAVIGDDEDLRTHAEEVA